MTTNQPARRTSTSPAVAERTVQDMIRESWSAISASLPDTMDGKRFARLVFNAVRKTPRLAEASGNSMIGSVLVASALGLEIGLNNEAHLVPYKRRDKKTGREWVEAQLIVGYGGLVKLFQQHPMARGVSTGWVGANDRFDFARGTSSFLDHRPALGDRGEPIAFWAAYELSNGVRDFEVLSVEAVARIRGKDANEERDIADPEHWMERKTVLKQVLKLAPKSTSLKWAMQVDEQPGGDLERQRTHVAIAGGDDPTAALAPAAGGEAEAEGEAELVDPETGEVLDEDSAVVDAVVVETPAGDGPAGDGGADAPGPGVVPVEASASPVIIDAAPDADEDVPDADSPAEVVPVDLPPLQRQTAAIRTECARLGIQAQAEAKAAALSAIVGRALDGRPPLFGLTRAEADGVLETLQGFTDADALAAFVAGVDALPEG